MRSLVLLGAWTLSLSRSFQVAVSQQDVDPAALIPLFSRESADPATPAATIDPLEWDPDEPTAAPDSSPTDSSNSDSSSSSSMAPGSSLDAASAASTSITSSGDEDIIAPEAVTLPVLSSNAGASASVSASSSTPSSATTSTVDESACAGTKVSVETVVGEFCVEGSSVCSGGNGNGACPGRQDGLLTGSHCTEVWKGVYGCRPGPKSSQSSRLRQ